MRVREHANARLRHDANDPGDARRARLAGERLSRPPLWLAGRRDARDAGAIERADLVAAAKRVIARDQLVIAVVGAIDEDGAAALVDKVFADLPAGPISSPSPRRRSPASARSTP